MTMTEAEYIELLAEIDRLRAANAALLAAARLAISPESTTGMIVHCHNELRAAIAEAEG